MNEEILITLALWSFSVSCCLVVFIIKESE